MLLLRLCPSAVLIAILGAACRRSDVGKHQPVQSDGTVAEGRASGAPLESALVSLPPRVSVPLDSLDESRGKWAPPIFPGTSMNVPATVGDDWVTSVQIGGEHIVLGKTPLDSVLRQLSAGPIGEGGDAASSVEWLCFTGGVGPDRWALWLEAGEIDGSNVGKVHMVSLSPDAFLDHRCHQLPAALSVVLPKGLTVGLTDSAVHRLVGPPSGVTGDTSIYWYAREPPAKGAVMTRVVLVTERGRVTQVAAWRSSAF